MKYPEPFTLFWLRQSSAQFSRGSKNFNYISHAIASNSLIFLSNDTTERMIDGRKDYDLSTHLSQID